MTRPLRGAVAHNCHIAVHRSAPALGLRVTGQFMSPVC